MQVLCGLQVIFLIFNCQTSAKIELPANWDELIKEYAVIEPEYHAY